MTSRLIVASSFSLLLTATPALPQARSQPAHVASTQASAAAPTTIARPPANMRAMVRTLGLDRQTSDRRFEKVEISADRAAFRSFVLPNPGGAPSTLDNLTITRAPRGAPNAGEYTLSLDGYKSAAGTTFGQVTVTGIRVNSDIIQTLVAISEARRNQPAAARQATRTTTTRPAVLGYAETIVFKNFVTEQKDPQGKPTTVRIGEMSMGKLTFDQSLSGFDDVALKDVSYTNKSGTLRFAQMDLRGTNTIASALLNLSEGSGPPNLNLKTLAFGGMDVTGLSFEAVPQARGSKVPAISFNLARLSLGQIRDGTISAFGFSGYEMTGAAGGAGEFVGKLASLRVSDINLNYFAAVTDFMAKAGRGAGKPSGENAQTSPSLTSQPEQPSPLLKDLLPGGPLDGGIGEFDMTDFSVGAMGFNFEIDKIGLRLQKTAAGLITKWEMVPTQFRFAWPQGNDGPYAQATKYLSIFGDEDIRFRISGSASFDPATDRTSFDDYTFNLVNFGQVKMAFSLTGINQLYTQTSIDQLLPDDFVTTMARRGTPAGAPLGKMFEVFAPMQINSARVDVIDEGGIERIARFPLSTWRNAGNTMQLRTPAQITETRIGWGSKLRQQAGIKTKPAFERNAALTIARFLESGGTVTFQTNLPQPAPFSALNGPPSEIDRRFGLTITHSQPATQR